MLQMNKYQSVIPEDLPKKIKEELIEYIETIPFIKHLISPEKVRGFAKDRPRHNELPEDDDLRQFDDDRIVVDVTKPHILEDMDFFRERAIFYKKNNKYTNLPPNPNPKSEYARFWKEELRRWKDGLVRPSDGEWVPGYLYFYWNYGPIWLVEELEVEGKRKKKRQQSERVLEFPKPWLGDYLFFHYIDQARKEGQHGKLLKMRGCGWSFKAATISPCNMYIYPGEQNINFHLASEKTFLTGDKGVFGKVISNLDWIATHTPLGGIRLINSPRSMEIQLGYQDGHGQRKGRLSQVNGISLKDNPEKARGIRGPFIQYEEDGLFPDLETAWGVNREAVESGSSSFGFMMAGGTGGTEGASFEGSKKLFYSPDGYNIYGVPNVYDKNVQSTVKCGFFWGAYMNRHRCYDEVVGEPDVIKALIEIIENRHLIARNTSDPAALTQARAEKPITPQEAIMRVDGTIFPVGDLSDYFDSIKPEEQRFIAQHYVGELVYDATEGVKWKPNADLKPIRQASVERGKNREGAVEIFELPKKDSHGKIQSGRYIAGIDPIDADEGDSLFSIQVMDLLTDRIVAEYTGRYPKAEQCYEIALKLCVFYNAQANYENNLKGLHSYFKNKNALHYLADTPEILKDMDMLKPSMSNPKGTRSTKPINSWGRQLQVTWMLSEAYSQENSDNTKLNLHTIRSLGYIEECITWNPDGNFDRVSAANMLFILREDRLRQKENLKEITTTSKSVSAWTNSKFFDSVYGKPKTNDEKYKSIFND
jgi:hypothetical protein